MENMEEFFNAVTNFGFPIVVSGYLLLRFEKKLEALEKSINGSDGIIVNQKRIIEKIEEHCKHE